MSNIVFFTFFAVLYSVHTH